MTKIERTIRELDDLRQFYYQIKQRKQFDDQATSSRSDWKISRHQNNDIQENHYPETSGA